MSTHVGIPMRGRRATAILLTLLVMTGVSLLMAPSVSGSNRVAPAALPTVDFEPAPTVGDLRRTASNPQNAYLEGLAGVVEPLKLATYARSSSSTTVVLLGGGVIKPDQASRDRTQMLTGILTAARVQDLEQYPAGSLGGNLYCGRDKEKNVTICGWASERILAIADIKDTGITPRQGADTTVKLLSAAVK